MSCKQCGNDFEAPAPFCAGCGATLSRHRRGGVALGRSRPPIVSVRPVFITSLHALESLPIYLFVAIWGTLACGGAAHIALRFFASSVAGWIPFALTGTLLATTIPFIGLRISRRAYVRSVFSFYLHRVEVTDGLGLEESTSIPLDEVVGIEPAATASQARHGLGTIRIALAPLTAGTERTLWLRDIAQPERVAAKIEALLDNRIAPEPEVEIAKAA